MEDGGAGAGEGSLHVALRAIGFYYLDLTSQMEGRPPPPLGSRLRFKKMLSLVVVAGVVVAYLRRRPPLGQTNALVKRVEVLTFNKYSLVIRNVLSLSS